jgi:hypothetical protein
MASAIYSTAAAAAKTCSGRIDTYASKGTISCTRQDVETYNELFQYITNTAFTLSTMPAMRAVMTSFSLSHMMMFLVQNKGEPATPFPSVTELKKRQAKGFPYANEEITECIYNVGSYIAYKPSSDVSRVDDTQETRETVLDFMYAFLLELCVYRRLDICKRNMLLVDTPINIPCYIHSFDRTDIELLMNELMITNNVGIVYQEIYIRLMPENMERYLADEVYTGSTCFKKLWSQGSQIEKTFMSIIENFQKDADIRHDAAVIAFVLAICREYVHDFDFRVFINRGMFSCASPSIFITNTGVKGIFVNKKWACFADVWDLVITYVKIVERTISTSNLPDRLTLADIAHILSGNFVATAQFSSAHMSQLAKVVGRAKQRIR